MRAAGLAALSGDVDGGGVVPIAQIENFSKTCARRLVEGTFIEVGCVYGRAIPGARDGAAIEERVGDRCDAAERMEERNAMQFSPGPVFGIRAQLGREFLLCRLECL